MLIFCIELEDLECAKVKHPYISGNIIFHIWQNRPKRPISEIFPMFHEKLLIFTVQKPYLGKLIIHYS